MGGGTALDWLVAILAGIAVPVLLILLVVAILTYGVRSAEREKARRDRAEREPGAPGRGDSAPERGHGDDDAPGGGPDQGRS